MSSYDFEKNLNVLRSSISITDYISQHIDLDRQGKGVCPFHDDTNPSLSVSEKKGIFKCFSCGVGGDVVKFHSLKTGQNIKESMEFLADKYKVSIEPFETGPAVVIDYNFTKYNNEAAKFLSFRLQKTPVVLSFIQDTRKLSLETLDYFKVGACMNNFELFNLLKDVFPEVQTNAPTDLFYNSNLPVFGGRIVFPLFDPKGVNVLGFAGRRIYATYENGSKMPTSFTYNPSSDDKEVAKYINSNNSSIPQGYYKGNYLYGLHNLKGFGQAIIVEGYFDVLAMFEMGYKNTVATCGTALTAFHLNRLSDKEVILALDFDKAGIESALKITRDFHYTNFKYGLFYVEDVLDQPNDASDMLVHRSAGKTAVFKVVDLYGYVEYILDCLLNLRFDFSDRLSMYKHVAEAAEAIETNSHVSSFMASEIRLMFLRKLFILEPDLKDSVSELLDKLYKKVEVEENEKELL